MIEEQYKQAGNEVIARIYKELTVRYLTNYLNKHRFFAVIDFNIYGNVYDNILYIILLAYSQESFNVLKRALDDFNKSFQASSQDLENIIKETGIIFNRPISKMDEELIAKIKELHREPWKSIVSLPTIDLKNKDLLSKNNLAINSFYEEENKDAFNQITIDFKVNNKLYKSHPARKALAVLLTQAISMNLREYLHQKYVFCLKDSSWDRGAKIVNYQESLSFYKKNTPKKSELQKACNDFIKNLVKSPTNDYSAFVINAKKLLEGDYEYAKDYFFDVGEMHRITYDIIIGNKGWRSVADEEMIKKIILNTVIRCN